MEFCQRRIRLLLNIVCLCLGSLSSFFIEVCCPEIEHHLHCLVNSFSCCKRLWISFLRICLRSLSIKSSKLTPRLCQTWTNLRSDGNHGINKDLIQVTFGIIFFPFVFLVGWWCDHGILKDRKLILDIGRYTDSECYYHY